MLDEAGELIEKVREIARKTLRWTDDDFIGDLYCPPCGGPRRMLGKIRRYDPDELALVGLGCLQCESGYLALWYNTSGEKNSPGRLALIPLFDRAGVSSPHTPDGVAYYLTQAASAQAMGAMSAAVAMYRAAVEQILLDQGISGRMLGNRIDALESAIKQGTAPKWAAELDMEYLRVLKDLGNAAVHGGDVKKQAALDSALVSQVGTTVSALLHLIYEVPHQKAQHKLNLKAAVAALKR